MFKDQSSQGFAKWIFFVSVIAAAVLFVAAARGADPRFCIVGFMAGTVGLGALYSFGLVCGGRNSYGNVLYARNLKPGVYEVRAIAISAIYPVNLSAGIKNDFSRRHPDLFEVRPRNSKIAFSERWVKYSLSGRETNTLENAYSKGNVCYFVVAPGPFVELLSGE